MQKQLKVLSVEDSEQDTWLLAREFKRGGFDTEFRRVDTLKDLRSALREGEWDIVCCDYSMPHFSGMEALETEVGKGTTFILRLPIGATELIQKTPAIKA